MPGASRRALAPALRALTLYVANFGSYDAAWGSLSAVIVLLTWLWLSALAILLGASVNASRGLRGRRGLGP